MTQCDFFFFSEIFFPKNFFFKINFFKFFFQIFFQFFFQTAVLWISRGGSTLLIIFLIITMLVFAIAKIWTISRVIHFNMELSLLLAHLCLLPVGIYENHPEMCKILSTLIHFFFLACFTFMFLEAIHLYALVGWVVKRYLNFFFTKYSFVLFF